MPAHSFTFRTRRVFIYSIIPLIGASCRDVLTVFLFSCHTGSTQAARVSRSRRVLPSIGAARCRFCLQWPWRIGPCRSLAAKLRRVTFLRLLPKLCHSTSEFTTARGTLLCVPNWSRYRWGDIAPHHLTCQNDVTLTDNRVYNLSLWILLLFSVIMKVGRMSNVAKYDLGKLHFVWVFRLCNALFWSATYADWARDMERLIVIYITADKDVISVRF